jgi:hypothetical protein
MSFTLNPASRKARAVPPVETSSTPKPAKAWANSTRPVLSVTLSNALRIRFSALTAILPFFRFYRLLLLFLALIGNPLACTALPDCSKPPLWLFAPD